MTYKAKTLVPGFKLGLEYAGKVFVAVPLEKAVVGNSISHNNEMMKIKTDPVLFKSFPDKFGRGTYSLCYYEWQKEPLW